MEPTVTVPTQQPTIITAPEAKTEAPVKDPFWTNLKADAEKAVADKPPVTKPEAAKPAPAAVEDDTPPEIRSEKGKADWKSYKAKLAEAEKAKLEVETKYSAETGTLKQQLAEIERKHAELMAKANPEEFEKLKAEREDLSLRLRVKDMTSDPQWERTFTAPINDAMREALSQVPADLKGKAEWMLKQPDSEQRTEALEEMIGSLRPLAQSRFANQLTIIDGKRRQMDAILAEAPKYVEKYEASRKVENEVQMNRSKLAKNQAFDAVTPKFTALPWAATPEETAKVAQESFGTARSYYESSDPDVQARVAHWAVFGEKALPRITALEGELKKANDVIKQLQGSKPGNGSVVQGASNTKQSKDPFADGFRVQS